MVEKMFTEEAKMAPRSIKEMLADPRPIGGGATPDCLPQIAGCAIRVARLEPNGVPDPGANNKYVSDALVLIGFEPDVEEGEEFTQKNGCGALVLSYKEPDQIKRVNITLQIATPDPQLHELLAGGTVLTEGDAIGYGYPHLNEPLGQNGVSLEVWSKRIDSSGDLDPDFPYAWWVFPKVRLTLGQKQIQNQPMENPFTGEAIENPNWFDGPDNDWPADSDRAVQWLPTESLPVTSCGFATTSVS